MGLTRRSTAALSAALIAASSLAAISPAQASSPGWPHGLTDPFARQALVADQVGQAGQLNGVYCPSATDCWAVGDQNEASGATLNQVLHWTGKKWFKVTVPEPAGTGKEDGNQLDAVRCPSATSCWAVGEYQKGNNGKLDQILHWTGKKWFVVSAPTPGGTLTGDVNELNDVACTSAASCWAVGDYGTDDSTTFGETLKNQALFWNGKGWKLMPTPNPAGAKKNHAQSISSIRCAGPDDCWGGGAYGVLGKKLIVFNQMLHWNGKKWTQVIVANPAGKAKGSFSEILGLSCTSAKSCLAVGVAERLGLGGRALNVILSWNGAKWVKIKAPNPDGSGQGSINDLAGVTCAAPRDCWAVGSFGEGPTHNQALHWTGTAWKQASTPNPGGNGKNDSSDLFAVRCASSTDCWAVGDAEHNNGPDQDEILHWNGVKWVAD